MCKVNGCSNVRTYNFDGLNAEFCRQHKSHDMINVRHERCTECRFQASFGYIDTNLREKCSIHKSKEMVNLKHKNIRCVGTDCVEARLPNMLGYCSEKCYINDHDEYTYDNNSSILYKEFLLFKHLKNTYTQHHIVWNKIYSCMYRPDFRISFDTFTILIELDEDQHRSYNQKNEIDRIENIYHTVGEPLYVIRLNPDNYAGYKSPFKNNILVNETDWNNRLHALTDKINQCINDGLCNTESTYEISYLFYD